MKEYIMQFSEGLLNEETGEVVLKPTMVGELIRCKDCEHYKEKEWKCRIHTENNWYPECYCDSGEKKNEE